MLLPRAGLVAVMVAEYRPSFVCMVACAVDEALGAAGAARASADGPTAAVKAATNATSVIRWHMSHESRRVPRCYLRPERGIKQRRAG